MLQQRFSPDPGMPALGIDIPGILGFLRRHQFLFGGAALAGLAAGDFLSHHHARRAIRDKCASA